MSSYSFSDLTFFCLSTVSFFEFSVLVGLEFRLLFVELLLRFELVERDEPLLLLVRLLTELAELELSLLPLRTLLAEEFLELEPDEFRLFAVFDAFLLRYRCLLQSALVDDEECGWSQVHLANFFIANCL